MYKPRIVLSPLRQYSYLLGPWRCEGRGVRAYGYTPAEAYRKWLDTRKREKQDGLFLARTARQAKEDRDRQRAIRRAQAHAQEKAAKEGEESLNNQFNQRVELKPWWWPF